MHRRSRRRMGGGGGWFRGSGALLFSLELELSEIPVYQLLS
jgi:hypothetical protein